MAHAQVRGTAINDHLPLFPWKGFDCRLSQLLPSFLASNQLACGIGLESSWEPYRTDELVPGCFPPAGSKSETKSPASPWKKLSTHLTSQLWLRPQTSGEWLPNHLGLEADRAHHWWVAQDHTKIVTSIQMQNSSSCSSLWLSTEWVCKNTQPLDSLSQG